MLAVAAGPRIWVGESRQAGQGGTGRDPTSRRLYSTSPSAGFGHAESAGSGSSTARSWVRWVQSPAIFDESIGSSCEGTPYGAHWGSKLIDDPAMEFCYCEFNHGKTNWFMKSINRIKLFPQREGGDIKFNCEARTGRWSYDGATKMMLIEFKSSKYPVPDRRHAFLERGDGSFKLLPTSDAVYTQNDLWTPESVEHLNDLKWSCIIMQKVALPLD